MRTSDMCTSMGIIANSTGTVTTLRLQRLFFCFPSAIIVFESDSRRIRSGCCAASHPWSSATRYLSKENHSSQFGDGIELHPIQPPSIDSRQYRWAMRKDSRRMGHHLIACSLSGSWTILPASSTQRCSRQRARFSCADTQPS